MHKGYLCLVFHAHLPYIRHPEHESFLEENWLYEAITETYIPLIDIFDRFINEGIDYRITMSLTPTLISMLQDPLLQSRYIRHLDRLIELAEKEIDRTMYKRELHRLALMYHRRFLEARELFVNKYKKDLISAFKKFQNLKKLEILTSCATHGYLPLLGIHPSAVRTQIKIAVDHYKKTFGIKPAGMWLPECGFYPGIDEVLREAGIRYFFLDTHGISNGDPRPKYGVYAPVYCPSGVAAFGRDYESSKQVWSSKEGYPGDPDYREFYKDIGYELEYDYIRPYIHKDGFRINTGIKYYRITGDTEDKQPYVPEWAREKAAIHADNFMLNREKQIEHLSFHMNRRPIVVAPYDAELFGHWWFEGPQWIDFLMRKIASDQKTIELITPSEYLERYPVNQISMPSASSWGYKGYNEVWIEGSNDWVYRHLHIAQERMVELVTRFSDIDNNKLYRRALNQAARELLLAQSSDWIFIMKTRTAVEYAHKRINTHLVRFTRLYNDIMNDSIALDWLKEVELRDNIFPDIDYSIYQEI
ncbi:MAG: glycoside hydrolase family 57 protein [Nitrospinota bacterium]